MSLFCKKIFSCFFNKNMSAFDYLFSFTNRVNLRERWEQFITVRAIKEEIVPCIKPVSIYHLINSQDQRK